MIKDKLLILFISFFGLANNAFPQTSVQPYVVITFEDVYKTSQHGRKDYYWIIPKDSIKSYTNVLSRLFLTDFSKNNLDDCCKGNNIDPFLITQNSSYAFDSTYNIEISKLENIIYKHRKRIQKITKNWISGQKEVITVFATPLIGNFCSSTFHSLGKERTGYVGKVYIPFSSFKSFDEFWKSIEVKFILNQDYSKIKFDVIPY